MGISVKREGREGVWIADKDSLVSFIESYNSDSIHNLIQGGGCGFIVGANWSKDEVIEAVKKSDRIGILTGEAMRNNMGHALSVIRRDELLMFDIGDVEGNLND